jgi:hypothetical protein
MKEGVESFQDLLIRQSAEIAERWLSGDFGPRGPYTQIQLDEPTAQAIASIALHDGLTIAQAARLLIDFALTEDEAIRWESIRAAGSMKRGRS